MSNASSVDTTYTEKNFLDQLNLIQNIIDGWVTALDPRRYQRNLPDPSNYLRVIVLGDKHAGKTTFIESILGVQLRVIDGEQDETASNLNNQFGGSESTPYYATKVHGDEANSFEYNEFSHDSRMFPIKQLSTSRDIPNVRTTLSSCTPCTTNRLASHQITSITAVTPNYYTDYRSNALSPRSSNSSIIRPRVAQRYSSIQTRRRQQRCHSSIPVLISLMRRSESCKVTVPIRGILVGNVITQSVILSSEPGAAFTVKNVSGDFNANLSLPECTGESTDIDVLAFLIQLERCWGAHSEVSSQGLHLFRVTVEQGEIIKAVYKLEHNEISSQKLDERWVQHSSSQAVTSQINNSTRVAPSKSSVSQKPSVSFLSRNVMLAQNSMLRALDASRSHAVVAPNERPNVDSVVYITFHLESLRFVAHILALGQFLEQLAISSEAIFPRASSKQEKTQTLIYEKEIMHVELSSPSLPNVQFLEIPGTSSNASKKSAEHINTKVTTVMSQNATQMNTAADSNDLKRRERAKHLLRCYALERTALFVNVVDASRAGNSIYTKHKMKARMPDTLRWTVELEPQGTRSLVVLSKLDLLENVGYLITSLISDGLPWAKEYERRAAVMFYNRYEQYLNSRQSQKQQTKDGAAVVESLEMIKKKRAERLPFQALGLHHPRVVALSFMLHGKNNVATSLCALELNDILSVCSALFTRYVENEKETLSRYVNIMSNHFDIFIGFKRLISSLVTTVSMTVGSQCIEPAATMLRKEKRRLDKKLELKLQKDITKTPIDQFEDCFKKFLDSLAFIFTKDQKQISLWAQQNKISSEEQINNHLLTSNVPFYTVLGTSCQELKKKLLNTDYNTIITEQYRQQAKMKNNTYSTSRSHDADVLHDGTQDQDFALNSNYYVKKVRIILDYWFSEFERVTKSCGSYLKTCLQTHVPASFSREFYNEEQLLAVQAIVTGVYQTQLLAVRKNVKLRFEQQFVTLKETMFFDKMSQEMKTKDHKQNYTYNASHENLIQTYQKLWTEVFDSMTYYLFDEFTNLTNVFLPKRSDTNISDETNELVVALRRVLVPENRNNDYSAKKDKLLIKMTLIQQAISQQEAYIESYPLLYHFCVASVTVSQLNLRENQEEETAFEKFTEKNHKKEESTEADTVDEKDASTSGKSSLINARTVSMICSGSIGAAVLYSLTRK